MIRGIDISQHQATTPNLDGLSFIVLRATIGTSKDTKYDQHYAAARAAGLVTMAYAFGYSADQVPIADQAALFLDVARDADFLWLDQEEQGFTDAQAQEFIDLVRKVRPCGLYHSASGFGGVSCDARWVADWRDASEQAGYPRTADGTREYPSWTIWQWDGGGADGIDNDLWNPDHPIAELLRKGYVPQSEYDAKVVALDLAESEIAALNAEITGKDEEIALLGGEVLRLNAALAEAPAAERERIALAEAERIRGL